MSSRFFICIILILFICIFIVGCTIAPVAQNPVASPSEAIESAKSSPTPSPTPPPKDGPEDLNIAVSLYNAKNFGESDYLKGIEDVFKTLNVKYSIYDAQGDSEKQMFQIREAVRQKPDALIVGDGEKNAIEETCATAEKKLPVIIIKENILSGENSGFTNGKIESVNEAVKIFTDNMKNGKIMFLNNGLYGDIENEQISWLHEALKMVDKELNIAKNTPTFEEGAHEVATWMMAYPNLRGIWANTPTALDSVLYMTELAGRNDIAIVGVSNNTEHLNMLKDGKLKAVIFPLFEDMGKFAAELAIASALEKTAPIAPASFYSVYNQENVIISDSPVAETPVA